MPRTKSGHGRVNTEQDHPRKDDSMGRNETTPLEKLAAQMRTDWDRRVGHDFRFWMGEGHLDDVQMRKTGERDFSAIVEGLKETSSQTALEIGCGVGRLLKPAAARFAKVIGVDVSRLAIDRARQLIGPNPAIELVVGSGVSLDPVEDSSVDFVWSFGALACMPVPVIAAYLRETKRVLRATGHARLQVYLGQELTVHESDTLHLRSFGRENFAKAVMLSGMDIIGCEERPITDDGSAELGIVNCIATIQQTAKPASSVDAIAEALLPGGESKEVNPAALEAWMALNYADTLADEGNSQKAREAVEYVVTHCQSATIDTKDLLDRVLAKSDGSASPSPDSCVFEENLSTLRERFPDVYERVMASKANIAEGITIKSSKDGCTVWSGATCLDHPDKPRAAGESWVRRSLQESRFTAAKQIMLVGFGGGYHVEALLDLAAVPVSCAEPDIGLFVAALRARDIRGCLQRLASLMVGDDVSNAPLGGNAELLIRPQVAVLDSRFVERAKASFYSKRGLAELRPKIAVLGPFHGGTLPTASYTCQALQRMGHRVRGIDVSGFNDGYMMFDNFVKAEPRRLAMRSQYCDVISNMLLENITEKPIDILICMAQAPISAKALTELRSRGVITVLWFVEDYLRFTYWRHMAKHYDFVFTIQKGACLDNIRAAGAGEVHYLPTACDPIFHQPLKLSEEEKARWGSPISFVGAGYHNRTMMFASLAQYPFKIWGSEWPTGRPFDRIVQDDSRRVMPEEYIKIFNASDINLNLHSSSERDGVDPTGDFVNPRTFELAASGAFQLCDERLLLPELFEVGKEIITFSDLHDLRQKIEYYRSRPEERAQVCAAARARVLKDHSYERRMEQMFSTIYASKYEMLRQREQGNPWVEMIRRAEGDPELKERCERAYARGEEPALDGLIADIVTGQGKLSETEQKLLFMHHVRSQIIRMNREEAGLKK
jgi:spore maturation protein CgeB